MPIRVRYKVQITLSSSNSEERDLGNNQYEVVNDEQNEGGTWKTTLAASASDVQILLGNVAAAQFLVVRTAAKDPTLAPVPVTLKINSTANDPITIDPMGASKEGLLVLTTNGLTGIYVTNTGATAMELTVSAAGD